MGGTCNLVLIGILSLLFAILSLTSAAHLSHMKGNAGEEPSLVPSSNSIGKAQELSELAMKPSTESDLRRHIRSVDQGILQSNEPQFESGDGIQSNSEAEDDMEVPHKSTRSLASPEFLRYLPPTALTRENEYALKNRWYLPSFGHFSRGGRADSHFIRFGRNANFDGSLASQMSGNSMNPNKKNNFIRLGRENPRQNNFIRLGRSGWGSNERFGSKIGYFPDYYTNLSGTNNPNVWGNGGDLPPTPYDNADFSRHQA